MGMYPPGQAPANLVANNCVNGIVDEMTLVQRMNVNIENTPDVVTM